MQIGFKGTAENHPGSLVGKRVIVEQGKIQDFNNCARRHHWNVRAKDSFEVTRDKIYTDIRLFKVKGKKGREEILGAYWFDVDVK